jgi:hypothetical protein
MALRLLPAVVLLVACSAHAQDADPNLQNLLTSLTTGSATTLVTPLRNGMAQVTTFQPGTRLSAAQANLMISQARDSLRALGETQPSAEEIARMLAGGPIELQSGRIQTTGMLRSAGWPAAISSQVMAASAPLPSAAANAAAGGSAPSPAVNAAREEAIQQLAALGILNPSEQQIRTALVGGTITTLNGAYELRGILTR